MRSGSIKFFPILSAENINQMAGLYLIWAVSHFFDWKKVSSYLKTILSLFLGAIVFTVLIISVGFMVEVVHKFRF
jgi:hypothetical protein